jgi:acyl carrier protein
MTDSVPGYQEIRNRINSILEQVLGYEPNPDDNSLDSMDSLHVLELLILLEDEFNIVSDDIIESDAELWSSIDQLVHTIGKLMNVSDDSTSAR